MDILVGIIAVVVGSAVCFAGYRLFQALLPVWGFTVGFWIGSPLADEYGSEAFLVATAGWIAGIIIGIVFALLSSVYWYFSIAFLGASVGASLGTGVVREAGIELVPWPVLGGMVAAIVLAAAIVLFHPPKRLVIAYTVMAGALLTLGGALLLLSRIEAVESGVGAGGAIKGVAWLAPIAWAVLAAIGYVVQFQWMGDDSADVRDWRNPRGHGMAPA
jgi:hypothetical protein